MTDATNAALPDATPAAPLPAAAARRTGSAAVLVAAGILASRVIGLVRNRVLAGYLGTSIASDAFNAAIRIPNFLQNLLGEGALSASFIPVYARLVSEGDEENAGRVAGAVFALLATVTSAVVLLGVLFAPALTDLIAPGFAGEQRDLTVRLVRVMFPGVGLLVLTAWCLGVLNSHRRFFLSYAAPVVSSLAIIAALVLFGDGAALPRLAEIAVWGAFAGSALQLGLQLPFVLRLVPRLRLGLSTASPHVRTVLRNLAPATLSRGVVQVSAFIDQMIASFLPVGSVALLSYASLLYTLPVSLFGMAVSAAELPAMSSVGGDAAAAAAQLRTRLDAALRRVAFFIVPSAAAFLAAGDLIAQLVLQNGRFTPTDARWVWAILAGSAVGLLASTMGRLYSSVYYARRDTRTPLRFAIARVALTIGLGYLFALPVPRLLGVDARWGTAGLTASAGIAGWVEFVLLRRSLNRQIGRTGLAAGYVGRLWGAAALAAAAAWALRLSAPVGALPTVLRASLVLGAFAVVYGGAAAALGVPMAREIVARVRRRTVR
jgi:putative peptidoglycan lipid II flippase